jgi:hypothetical protein
MYRSCMFCSAPLGSNESLERFPVGRSLAFDAEKGRLWAVCPKCARWNLAPIEERWEAIEDAERLFRDTRLRVQRENIGLAKLVDGTRLVRVGEALVGELAAWRYGETLSRRRRRYLLVGGAVTAVSGAGMVAGIAGLGAGVISMYWVPKILRGMWDGYRDRRVVQRLHPRTQARGGAPITVRRRDLAYARLLQTEDGGLALRLPQVWGRWAEWESPEFGSDTQRRHGPLVVTGKAAHTLLARAMVHLNEQGARQRAVDQALVRIADAGSPDAFLQGAARAEHLLVPVDRGRRDPTGNLALEMALHEETERRALDGELAMLEAMWREAEQIAAIADQLPDLPAPEPPRLMSPE